MNKSHTSALCLLFMLILCRTPLSAQSTMGTDFWLSFIIPDELLDSNSSYSLIFATDHIDTITVSNPLLGWQKQLTAYPNQVNRLYIPYSVSLPNGNIPVSSSGIHVSSRRPISLYASIHSIASLDITNVMPTPALRDDYIVQTYPNGRYSSVFSIVATQENTEVEIQLLSDDPTRIDSSFTVQLPLPGKVYYFHTYGDADFSGTQIHARNNKRIALFCGNPRTFVPEYDERQSGDITYEQCIPTSFWGNDYIVVPCGRKTYHDHLRITALNDDCHVFVADTLAALLSAQQTYEHCLSSDSDICHIHSTQPILVGHYFASTHDGTSDPSLIFVPPLDLAIDNLQFACVNTPMTERHKAVILVRTEALLSLQFDGNPIGHHFRSLPNHDDYHYARILIDTGSHTLTSLPGNQFIAYLYGMGNHESYGYTAGYAVINSAYAMMTADDTDTRLLPQGLFACKGDSTRLAIRSTFALNSVLWRLDGAPISSDSSFTLHFDTHGQHLLEAEVSFDSLSSAFVTYADTLISLALTIDTVPVTHIHDTITDLLLPYSHAGITYYASTEDDTLHYHSSGTCDSIEIYSLTVLHAPDSNEDFAHLWIPNIFTPDNSDNNRFVVTATDILQARIAIFDRTGTCLAAFDALTQSWDGTCQGQPCPTGTYIYRITYRTKQIPHSDQSRIGTVTLIR